jgi:hypothetical protein
MDGNFMALAVVAAVIEKGFGANGSQDTTAPPLIRRTGG